jgi:hypothetical protein
MLKIQYLKPLRFSLLYVCQSLSHVEPALLQEPYLLQRASNVATLDLEFIVLGSNNNTRQGTQNGSVVIKNPDYGLSGTNSRVSIGRNFMIDSTTDQGLKYTSANVRLIPTSLPPGTKLSGIDPETDLIQQTPLIPLGSYQGNVSSIVIPQTTHPGYYLIYVHVHYPSLGITTVYSALLGVGNSIGVIPAGTIPAR